MNFISCVKWVKQGVAKQVPDNIHLNEDELREIVEPSKSDDETGEPSKPNSSDDEYDFKNYDQEDDLRVSLRGIATFDSVKKGKKKKFKKKNNPDDSDDSEKEDELIQEDDNLLVVGHVDDDFNTLDIYVYNENDGDMYIHHDIVLKKAPLCIDWLNIPSASETNNICAIGNMSPVIEVWDLDIINSVEPVFKLGRHRKKTPEKNYGHTDAVLSLAWNSELPHILCSGGVDNRALLWDLDDGKVATEITTFTDKVQNVAWNPHNPYFLLTGSADGHLRNFDCRLYDQFMKFDLESAVESIYWDTINEHCCFAGTEDGDIFQIDWRMENKPVHQFHAHNKEVTGVCIDRSHPNVLVSISTDEFIKFWDSSENFKLRAVKDLKLESLHCIDLNPDFPYLAGIGGSSEKCHKTIMKVVNLNDVSSTEPPVPRAVLDIPNTSEYKVPLIENEETNIKVHKKKLRKKMAALEAKKNEKKKIKSNKYRQHINKRANKV